MARPWLTGPDLVRVADRPSASGGAGVPSVPGPAASASPESGVVTRARQGDVDAVAALYETHVDRVHRFIRFRVADPAAAVDLTHDVFVAMLAGLPDLREADRFGAWLMRIAHHRVVDHFAWAARRDRMTLDDRDDRAGRDGEPAGGGETGPDAAARLGHDPRESVDRGLDAAAVIAQVRHLEPDQQHVVALRFVADLSVAETAAILERSEDAIKKLQRRALANLRVRVTRQAVGA